MPGSDEPDLEEIKLEFYKQGSEACRNYSTLTMQVRTLSQQILVLAIAGIMAGYFGAIVPIPRETLSEALLFGGVAVNFFAVSLGLVDWHYQSAFSGMRNMLAAYEADKGLMGPWRSHLRVRGGAHDVFASYFPFLALAASGGFVIWNEMRSWLLGIASVYGAIVLFFVVYSFLSYLQLKRLRRKLDHIAEAARAPDPE